MEDGFNEISENEILDDEIDSEIDSLDLDD